jgi:hypothetical protein
MYQQHWVGRDYLLIRDMHTLALASIVAKKWTAYKHCIFQGFIRRTGSHVFCHLSIRGDKMFTEPLKDSYQSEQSCVILHEGLTDNDSSGARASYSLVSSEADYPPCAGLIIGLRWLGDH